MLDLTLAELVPILQVAVGPVILISGTGLLLLTMTNRLSRTIDRVRALAAVPAGLSAEARQGVDGQLSILWRRARLIRLAITLAATSELCAALLVITLFFTALLELESAYLVGGLFSTGMALLIGSLIVFIQDVNLSLAALKLELQSHELRGGLGEGRRPG